MKSRWKGLRKQEIGNLVDIILIEIPQNKKMFSLFKE